MFTVLSTKKLELSQKQLLLNSGIGLVEYDAIKIEILPFSAPNFVTTNLIFTSKNAVKAVMSALGAEKLAGSRIFCVGEKTKISLEEAGLKVSVWKHYGKELAETIVQEYSKSSFLFFCGDIRRDELPDILMEHNIELEEVKIYSTLLNRREFNQNFDAVLFYSPSGVQSFCTFNEMKDLTAICIGKITASEAEKHSAKTIIATKPTIENVIVQAVKFFKETAPGGKVENI